MLVGVEGDPCWGVPQVFLNGLWVRSLGDGESDGESDES
jgi:hypothetical protein